MANILPEIPDPFAGSNVLPEIPDAFAGLTEEPDLDEFVELPDYIPRSHDSFVVCRSIDHGPSSNT
jgi:hypothetical protein